MLDAIHACLFAFLHRRLSFNRKAIDMKTDLFAFVSKMNMRLALPTTVLLVATLAIAGCGGNSEQPAADSATKSADTKPAAGPSSPSTANAAEDTGKTAAASSPGYTATSTKPADSFRAQSSAPQPRRRRPVHRPLPN